ncbi:hypothetical protein BC628DRAFT_1392102 [Trametes gibbosa]|nr:hypothetical protein BC628DRAFT_1392102 [Trametes gibbosa]
MAIMEPNGEPDVIMRVWSLLSEMSEQLSQNRSSAVNIHGLADSVKVQAIHSQTGFVLRRFNLDQPKDVYEAELERMNAAMSAENQTLLNDNRQLSTLIREYEQTLEKAMEKFRAHAHEVQHRELAIMRQYESIIIERETEAVKESLSINNTRSESLVRISRLLRIIIRKMGGEDIQAYQAYALAQARAARSAQSREVSSSSAGYSSTQQESAQTTGGQEKGKKRDDHTPEEEFTSPLGIDALLSEEEDPEKRVATAGWSLEREIELARLERENEELRMLVTGLLNPAATPSHPGTISGSGTSAPIPVPQDHPNRGSAGQNLGEEPDSSTERGPPSTRMSVGPFGTYKAPSPPRIE